MDTRLSQGAGALGARLAGRLTAELILRSPQYMSAVKDYEIDLRGECKPATCCSTGASHCCCGWSKTIHVVLALLHFAGNKITTIENLGATEVSWRPDCEQLPARPAQPPHFLNWIPAHLQNQFDSIDLSDNMIVRLEGFPKLPRLKTLLLYNNRIVRVGRHLEGELQALHPISVGAFVRFRPAWGCFPPSHQHSCMAEQRHRAIS